MVPLVEAFGKGLALRIVESDGTDEFVFFEFGGGGESAGRGEALIGAFFFSVKVSSGSAEFAVGIVLSQGSFEPIIFPIGF